MTHWPDLARRFAESGAFHRLDPGALDFLKGLPPGQPVLVACSGGADSVFLLLCLHALFAETPERIHVVHFNHGIRGVESNADAAFVRELAAGLGHPFAEGKSPVPLAADEACLRQARYAWFGEIYQRTGAGALVLGQHADDLVESQLMALLSGSGPAGFASPLPLRRFPDGEVRLRPLLGLKRREILEALDNLPVPYRMDSSNEDTDYTRNWLRQEIVPMLAERFPQDIHAGSRRTRQLMEEATDALDKVVKALQLDLSNPVQLDLHTLIGQAPGLVRRAIMAWWLRHYPAQLLPTRPADALVEAVSAGKTGLVVSVGVLKGRGVQSQVIEFKEDGALVLRPEQLGIPVRWQSPIHWHWSAGPLYLPDGTSLSGEAIQWEKGTTPYQQANPAREAWVSGVEGPLLVRQWEPGDRYRPLGAPGSRKLQDIFTDAKLNSEQKAALPVILDRTGQILWIPGFAPAEAFRICQNHNSALKLTYNMH